MYGNVISVIRNELGEHVDEVTINSAKRFFNIENLKAWTKSENRWLRRASAVTLILPARKGEFLNDVFEIADSLLKDKDDLVQKGYGWTLKEASRKHREEVFEYNMKAV